MANNIPTIEALGAAFGPEDQEILRKGYELASDPARAPYINGYSGNSLAHLAVSIKPTEVDRSDPFFSETSRPSDGRTVLVEELPFVFGALVAIAERTAAYEEGTA